MYIGGTEWLPSSWPGLCSLETQIFIARYCTQHKNNVVPDFIISDIAPDIAYDFKIGENLTWKSDLTDSGRDSDLEYH